MKEEDNITLFDKYPPSPGERVTAQNLLLSTSEKHFIDEDEKRKVKDPPLLSEITSSFSCKRKQFRLNKGMERKVINLMDKRWITKESLFWCSLYNSVNQLLENTNFHQQSDEIKEEDSSKSVSVKVFYYNRAAADPVLTF